MGYGERTGVGFRDRDTDETVTMKEVILGNWSNVASSLGPIKSSHTFAFLQLEKITQEPRRKP